MTLDLQALGERIVERVERSREELVDLCRTMVAAPSITPPGDTRAVAEAVMSWLESRGHSPQVRCDLDEMPNILVTVAGAEPGPHVVLNGHLDTMDPGDASRWTVPIFDLTRRDGRLYGLGMGNMKGGVAALCMATQILAEEADSMAGTVTLALVSDEVRFGPHGTQFLLDQGADVHCDAVISAEGAGWMTLAIAEKGVAWVDLEATGTAGHATAAHTGETAVARMAGAIASLDELNDWYVEPPSELATILADPLHSGLRVAVNAGIVVGGDARSMIAPTASSQLDVRLPPGLSLEDLDARIGELVAPSNVSFRRARSWPANWTGSGDPLVTAVADAAHAVRGQPPEMTVRHPASDVLRWRKLGSAGVCYGPQPTLSAGVDDYAEEQDVLDCAATYALAVLSYCRSAAQAESAS